MPLLAPGEVMTSAENSKFLKSCFADLADVEQVRALTMRYEGAVFDDPGFRPLRGFPSGERLAVLQGNPLLRQTHAAPRRAQPSRQTSTAIRFMALPLVVLRR